MNADAFLSAFIRVHLRLNFADKSYIMSTATATGTRLGKYSVLQAELPGHGLVNLGVLLQDPQTDALRLRLRRDLELLVSGDEMDFFAALADDLSRKADELGSEKLFVY